MRITVTPPSVLGGREIDVGLNLILNILFILLSAEQRDSQWRSYLSISLKHEYRSLWKIEQPT